MDDITRLEAERDKITEAIHELRSKDAPIPDDAFSAYPHRMTEQEANNIAHAIQAINSNALIFCGIESQRPVVDTYEVHLAYNGARMVWQEPRGRQHRLNRGITKLTNKQEWEDIYNILTKGINVEF